MELIDNRIKKRAFNAFKFLPFNRSFYSAVQSQGLNADIVFENSNQFCVKEGRWFKNSSSVENAFIWLIKVGILRREVDGQGLTSRIRLTPLGRQLLEKYPRIINQKSNILQTIISCLSLRLQF